MKLTKKEAQKICEEYQLGKIKRIESIKKGLENYNFVLTTNKGKFIVRMLGQKLNEWKKKCLNFQFNTLDFLEKNKFPYQIPKPIKNIQGEEISSITMKNFWVYEFIEGKTWSYRDKNEKTLMEMAKSIALYHKTIVKLKVEFGGGEEGFRKWIYEGLEKMKNSNPKDKADKLAKENAEFFERIINQMSKRNFRQNLLANHRDFNGGNFLFKKGKIIAIIDFDNLEVRPRVNDIATSIEYHCFTKGKFDKKKMNLFLETYEKYNPLTKKEKEIIPYYMLQELCAEFRWVYDGMEKEQEKRYKFMKHALNKIKEIIKRFNLKEILK